MVFECVNQRSGVLEESETGRGFGNIVRGTFRFKKFGRSYSSAGRKAGKSCGEVDWAVAVAGALCRFDGVE